MRWIEALAVGSLLVLIGIEFQRTRLSSNAGFSDEEDREGAAALCFPALFSFGSSVADTGTLGAVLGDSKYLKPPYGCTFFGRPTGRVCDGRALIDFWATALRLPFVDPYLKSIGSNFRRGANFAASGSLAARQLVNAPFDLKLQVNQFQGFKRQVLESLESKCQESQPNAWQNECQKLPRGSDFGDALYIIAVGGNDVLDLYSNFPVQELPALVPEILYSEGARNILIENVYPQGCVPYVLNKFVTSSKDLDHAGCYTPVNDVVQLHNFLLKEGVTALISHLPDASIAIIDTYTPRYEIFSNYEKYGFTVRYGDYLSSAAALALSDGDMKAIIDQGSPLRDIEGSGAQRSSKCVNVSAYVMWDNYHFTDAVNVLTMRSILSGRNFFPKFDVVRNDCTTAKI